MSFSRLQRRIDELRNPTVVGLDPDLAHIPDFILNKHIREHGEGLEAAALAVYEWGTGLIDALCDVVPAVKPQSAFYEALGPHGVLTLKKTCDYARSKGMYVIVDAKRGDIGSTAAAYASAYLGSITVGNSSFSPFTADALTVNAYLGSDGVLPFLSAAKQNDRAIFALVKTSNPSAGELQDKIVTCETGDGSLSHSKVYTLVGDLLAEISKDSLDDMGFSRIGAVVGATYPEESAFLRARLPNTFFLVPGYGAQGASAADVAVAFNGDGKGAIVNSSRGIIAAWKKSGGSFAEAARDAAIAMRDELRGVI